MPVRLVPFAARPNTFDLEVDGTLCWRPPASWWRAQTRESLAVIGADDLGTSVDAVLAAIGKALPSDVAQVVSDLRQAAGLPVDYPYTYELVALKEWIEVHRKVSGMMTLSDKQDLGAFRTKAAAVRKQLEPSDYEAPDATIVAMHREPLLRESLERVLRAVTGKADVSSMVGEIGTPGFDGLVDNLASERVLVEMGKGDYEALKDRHAHELRLQINIRQEVAEALGLDRMASFEDIVRRARVPENWQGGWCAWAVDQFVKLARYLDKRFDKKWLVGGADGGWAQKGEGAADVAIRLLQASDSPQLSCDCTKAADWDDELERIKDRHEHELRTQTNMRQEVAEALGLERAAPIVKIIAEARRRVGAVTRLREVCAAVLGIKVSEVDADPDVEAVIADVWKAPRRAVPEGLFGRLLADLGAEASRVLGATPTDLVYSADPKDDTVIARLRECISDSEMVRKRGLQSITPMTPPPVTNAAEEIERLRALVDRQGNELGELRKVTGGPTDLELRRMICQDLVWRGDMIARQEHQIESLRSDLREAEAALRAEHERIAEVSLAAQLEAQRTRERVDGVFSRVVSVENVQRMHDLLGEAADADDHVTRLLSRYADLVGGSVSTPQSDPTASEPYWPCPTHGVHSFPSKPCYVCGWKPEWLPVREDSSAAAPSAPLKPYAGHVLVALQNLTAIAEYKPSPGATINVSGIPGRGVWVRGDGLQHVPGILPAQLGRTFEIMSPTRASPVTCTWLGEFAAYDGVRLAPVYLPNEVPMFDPEVLPTAPLDHPQKRESNHTVRGRNNSESVESDLVETLRATRQDAAELETEVVRLQGEVDASIECCKERDAWRTWALRGLPDMSDRTDEQLRSAWSDRAAAFAYRCLSQETEERLHHLLGVDDSVHADEAVHQLCEEYTRQRDAVDNSRLQRALAELVAERSETAALRATARHVEGLQDDVRRAVDRHRALTNACAELRRVCFPDAPVTESDDRSDIELLRWAGEQIVLLRGTDTAKLRNLWQRLVCGPAASTIARVDPELEQQMRQACWPGHEVPLTGLEAPADALTILRVMVYVSCPLATRASLVLHARGSQDTAIHDPLTFDAKVTLNDDDSIVTDLVMADALLDALRPAARMWAAWAEGRWLAVTGHRRK